MVLLTKYALHILYFVFCTLSFLLAGHFDVNGCIFFFIFSCFCILLFLTIPPERIVCVIHILLQHTLRIECNI